MNHSDFKIGLEFTMSGRRWRCTDVGSRVAVAISLEPHSITIVDKDGGERHEVSDDPSWLNGPPYAVPETVIDECDMGACEVP